MSYVFVSVFFAISPLVYNFLWATLPEVNLIWFDLIWFVNPVRVSARNVWTLDSRTDASLLADLHRNKRHYHLCDVVY